MEKFEKLLKRKRKEYNYSQQDLAEKINVDSSYIAKLESGARKKPSPEVVMELSKVFKMNFTQLLNIAGYNNLEIKLLLEIGNAISFDKTRVILKNQDLKNFVTEYNDEIYLDIEKILNHYKNDKLSLEDTVKLIHYCEPIDIGVSCVYVTDNQNIIIDNEEI